MQAIVYTQYGPPEVLKLREVPKPVPKDQQVLVKVRAASVNAFDGFRFRVSPFVVRLADGRLLNSFNTIPGVDLAGQVEAVGAGVTQFRPGDEVFGLAAGVAGAFAEYACASESGLALKPANVSFEAAAAVPNAGGVALRGMRDQGRIQPGQTVLIYGASGGIGTFAMQLAKAFGAEVTAVCSPRYVDLARTVGADHVIDYTRENFTQNGQRYDVIGAVNGYRSIFDYRRALKPGGVYVMLGGSIPQILQALLLGPLLSRLGTKPIRRTGSRTKQAELVFLGELLQTGALVPVIDRRYPLREVPEAIRYLIDVHAQGKVIITL